MKSVEVARFVSSGARLWKSLTMVLLQRGEDDNIFAQPSLQGTKVTEWKASLCCSYTAIHFQGKLSATSANRL